MITPFDARERVDEDAVAALMGRLIANGSDGLVLSGTTGEASTLTDDEKRDALAAHARARGFALSDEVAAYLLTHARRDMPSLIQALDALDRYSLETGRAITVPLLKAALQPSLA